MARLPVPPWRHRDQHPAAVRDDLDADDLRTADLPEARAPGPALAPLALAGSRDPPPEIVYARLAEQPHRRFIKTHTPLDGIPLDPRVTYIVTGRHPLDMFVSLRHQIDWPALVATAAAGRSAPPGQRDRLGSAGGPPWPPGPRTTASWSTTEDRTGSWSPGTAMGRPGRRPGRLGHRPGPHAGHGAGRLS